MKWTEEKLRSLSDDDLFNVYENCDGKTSDDAKFAIDAIHRLLSERENLSAGDTGLKLNSLVGRLMIKIINSPEGVAAAIAATQRGEPALADVEPLIVRKLGVAYTKRHEATVQAGFVLGKMMTRLGHRKTGQKGPMPDSSIASTSEIYVLKS